MSRMSESAWELAQERRATERERGTLRRAERAGKRAEASMASEAYRLSFGKAAR